MNHDDNQPAPNQTRGRGRGRRHGRRYGRRRGRGNGRGDGRGDGGRDDGGRDDGGRGDGGRGPSTPRGPARGRNHGPARQRSQPLQTYEVIRQHLGLDVRPQHPSAHHQQHPGAHHHQHPGTYNDQYLGAHHYQHPGTYYDQQQFMRSLRWVQQQQALYSIYLAQEQLYALTLQDHNMNNGMTYGASGDNDNDNDVFAADGGYQPSAESSGSTESAATAEIEPTTNDIQTLIDNSEFNPDIVNSSSKSDTGALEYLSYPDCLAASANVAAASPLPVRYRVLVVGR